MILSAFLLTACQKQPQPEIKLPEPQAAASPAQPGPETVEQTLTLGLIDFEADKELLRGLIQSYNASGAPSASRSSTTPTAPKATRTPSRAARPSSWPGTSPTCSTAAT